MPARWQRVRISIPKGFKPKERQAIADEILEHIKERTESGIEVVKKKGSFDGVALRSRKFPGYSKAYKASLDFEIAGKSNTVDLTLSGDMLAEMDLLSHKNCELRIGFRPGSEENARADGNIRGSSGPKNQKKKRKKRDFLGIQPKVLRHIIEKHEKKKQ